MNHIKDCLPEVWEWMDTNLLKPPNNEKTEVIQFELRHLNKVTLHRLNVCGIIVRVQDVAKDRGVTLVSPDDDD